MKCNLLLKMKIFIFLKRYLKSEESILKEEVSTLMIKSVNLSPKDPDQKNNQNFCRVKMLKNQTQNLYKKNQWNSQNNIYNLNNPNPNNCLKDNLSLYNYYNNNKKKIQFKIIIITNQINNQSSQINNKQNQQKKKKKKRRRSKKKNYNSNYLKVMYNKMLSKN